MSYLWASIATHFAYRAAGFTIVYSVDKIATLSRAWGEQALDSYTVTSILIAATASKLDYVSLKSVLQTKIRNIVLPVADCCKAAGICCFCAQCPAKFTRFN